MCHAQYRNARTGDLRHTFRDTCDGNTEELKIGLEYTDGELSCCTLKRKKPSELIEGTNANKQVTVT